MAGVEQVQGHGSGAELGDGQGPLFIACTEQQPGGGFHGVGLDVDDGGGQATELEGGNPVIQLFPARCGE